ncbi:MAG: hypothetical protein EB120_09725, partial [Proteobacteria bacterium]|nr:hypothetical protein [Pseudomonadota bacterium]
AFFNGFYKNFIGPLTGFHFLCIFYRSPILGGSNLLSSSANSFHLYQRKILLEASKHSSSVGSYRGTDHSGGFNFSAKKDRN